ncbi:MAG: division/cell wall cluster transcriptional repressor MraZ [Polyangiaceae bacterium]|jgi:MraZ protein|nr:division/cell wall cluster transcriptional repressor MraZ [Polyangiaceae bacterium]MBK8941144.1 division/cell wall cluster transcriptional repressor MraZ [Polyangiaceae bacterium]
MFRGHFEHAIDDKGRTSLPVRFRDVLGPASDFRLVVTPALGDPCLDVYPMKAWEELEAKLATLNAFDPQVIEFRRFYVSAAVECELDKQGRILVPTSLREHASLQKTVMWLGHGQKAELWSKEQWVELSKQKNSAELRDLRAAMGRLGL